MSAKIIFDTKEEIPETLRDDAREVEGKFELDAKGVLNKNKQLLADNAKLKTEKAEAIADKEASDASAKEWKGKAKIPTGQKIVSDEVAELGEAAKAAEISKDEMPTLKTAKQDLQAKLDAIGEKSVREQAAASVGKQFENFDDHATARGLKFSKKTEKQGDKDVDYFVVVGKDAEGKDTETRLTDYVKDKSLPDAQENKSGFQFGGQGKTKSETTEFDEIRSEMEAKKKAAQPTDNNSVLAALGGQPAKAATN